MIALISIVCIIGVFVAGQLLSASTLVAYMLLGVCVVALGVIIAAMELRAVEGQRVQRMPLPWTWEKLWLNSLRLAMDRNTVLGPEPLYVLTGQGPVPVTGLFTARINHQRSLVLDTTEAEPEDATLAFNQLKQGVM